MTQSIGPPSLAQGTRIAVGFSTSISRFIPAYAGNSAADQSKNDLPPVHPRLRGELDRHDIGCVIPVGSSPLTRGTPAKQLAAQNQSRFIPAYAGNSGYSYQAGGYITVHPRLRGELNLRSDNVSEAGGSSPLTRGTHLHSQLHFSEGRFIPAYAGNSSIKRTKIALGTVHPRLRGELPIETPETLVVFGSSPLTRGTQRTTKNPVKTRRFIPAYAGNSGPDRP